MEIKPIRTRKFLPPKDELLSVIKESISDIPEKSVLAVTSKVVSIWQGRCLPKNKISKEKLIKTEAVRYAVHVDALGKRVYHTVVNNILVRSSGIDESNGNGFYILQPDNPEKAAKEIRDFLRKFYKIRNIGVVITDSYSVPLHRGALGFSLGLSGFYPVNDYRGSRDIFGRKMKSSQSNVADGLAAAAVLAMGEGREKTPFALITETSAVRFTNRAPVNRRKFSSFYVPWKEDIFYPFFSKLPWQKGGDKNNKNKNS